MVRSRSGLKTTGRVSSTRKPQTRTKTSTSSTTTTTTSRDSASKRGKGKGKGKGKGVPASASTVKDRAVHVEVKNRKEWRAWLAENHTSQEPIWLVTYKKHCGPSLYMPWNDIVREALCFGWIDSTVNRIDSDRVKHLMCPRKRGSAWSGLNKRHVTELIDQGDMHATGLAKIEEAKRDGSWNFLDDIEAGHVPADLGLALRAKPAALATFEQFPFRIKRALLHWIKTAKRENTRKDRIAKTVREAALGRAAYGQ